MVNAGNGIITGWPKPGMMMDRLEAEMRLKINVRPTFWRLTSEYYFFWVIWTDHPVQASFGAVELGCGSVHATEAADSPIEAGCANFTQAKLSQLPGSKAEAHTTAESGLTRLIPAPPRISSFLALGLGLGLGLDL